MQVPHFGSWKGILLVCLFVSSGLFAAFNIISRNQPPRVTDVITVRPVAWELAKSNFSSDFPLWFVTPEEVYGRSSYVTDVANITVETKPIRYDAYDPWFDHSDVLNIGVNLTATVAVGFVESVRLTFREDYNASYMRLDAWGVPDWVMVRNLSVTQDDWAWSSKGWWMLEGNEKAWVQASCQNQSKHVEFGIGGNSWIFDAPKNLTQQLEASAEVTFFNGTSDVKVVLPTLINLIADADDTFDTARTITAGNYTGCISAFYPLDLADYYRLWLAEGQNVAVSVITRQAALEVALYDANRTLIGSMTEPFVSRDPTYVGKLSYTAGTDGYVYVAVLGMFDDGFYRMTIEVT